MTIDLGNSIIFIASVLLSLVSIFEIFGKPIQFLSKKRKEEIARREQEEKKEMEKRQREITMEIVDRVSEQFRVDMADKQKHIATEIVDKVSSRYNENLELLITSSKDLLRISILRIYESNKKTRTLSETKKQMLDDLYKDYTAENGNHYITFIYNKMCKWTIVPDDDEDDE